MSKANRKRGAGGDDDQDVSFPRGGAEDGFTPLETKRLRREGEARAEAEFFGEQARSSGKKKKKSLGSTDPDDVRPRGLAARVPPPLAYPTHCPIPPLRCPPLP